MVFLIKAILIIFLCTNLGATEKHFYLLGGGGEPEGETTIFDSDLKNLKKFTKNPEWKTTISFDGGHSKTENLIKSEFNSADNKGGFTEANMERVLLDLTDKIKNGTLKKGDKLFLTINSHGVRKTDLDKTHRVSFAYKNSSIIPQRFLMDRLETIIGLASEKEIKLAIIDFSCFSGNTLNLALKNTCVISATGTDHYSYTTFSSKFFESMEKGKNLEEVYLESRMVGKNIDFPMISTQEGQDIQDLLYKMLTPYLYFNDSRSDFDYSNMYNVKNVNEKICSLEAQNKKLNLLLDQIQGLKKIQDEILDVSTLKKALDEYRNYQKKYEKNLISMKEVGDEIENILERDYQSQKKRWQGIDPVSFLTKDYKELEKYKYFKKMYDEAKTDEARKAFQNVLDEFVVAQKISDEVKDKLSVKSHNIINTRDTIFKNLATTLKLASGVASEAKKVYNQIYRRSISKKSNPCRDFVL